MNDRAHPGAAIVEITDSAGVRWRVVESAVPLLFEGSEILPAARIRGRTVIRSTRSRHVERIDLEGGSVVVKRYPSSDPGEGLARRVSGRIAADVEFDRGRELQRRRFPVAEALACGQRIAGFGLSESILIMRLVEGVVLQEIVVGARRLDRPRRVALIDALADLMRRLHAAGVTHEDLHLGNLLVSDLDGTPRLALIDLRRVVIGAPPDLDRRLEALASLGRLTYGRLSRSERLRFFQRYLGGESVGGLAARARQIDERALVLLRAFARRRAKSALGGDSRFVRERLGRIHWIVRKNARSPELGSILEDPERPFLEGGEARLKSGRSSTVASYPPFVVKRFNLKKVRNLLLDRVRPSRARKSLARAIVLEELQVPTARVVAAGEARRGGLVTRGYLVMAMIPGAVDLGKRLAEAGDDPALARAAGALIATLHARGLVHRDLKASNFLVAPEGALSLIDLDGLSSQLPVDDDRAGRDVARLARDFVARKCDALSPHLVEGYLSVRNVADPERFRRAAGVAGPVPPPGNEAR